MCAVCGQRLAGDGGHGKSKPLGKTRDWRLSQVRWGARDAMRQSQPFERKIDRREKVMDPSAARHILVVEDDDSYRRLVARMLERAGYRVTVAADFDAAMKVIDGAEPIDLLLTDIGMPAGTPHGVSISRVAEFRRTGLKILYMTGGHDVTKFAQFAPGATVLNKPFTADRLAEAVKALLG